MKAAAILKRLELVGLIILLLISFAPQVKVHAAGDDYPWSNADSNQMSPLRFNFRNCTDFVAWRLNKQQGVISDPWKFTWATLGFSDGTGHARDWKTYAAAKGYDVSSPPKIGSVAWWGTEMGGGYGHVAIVSAVNANGTVNIEQYNGSFDYKYSIKDNVKADAYLHIADIATNNQLSYSLPGSWAGDNRQDFAYITKRSDGGYDVAIQKSTPTGLQWQGVWWSQPGPNIAFDNTSFIPADMDGDGLLDIYYATSTNWNNVGFTVGLMHNNGHGFDYWGTQWAPTNLKLSETKFLPGDWVGNGRSAFAYVTKNSDAGFSVAVFKSTVSGIQWQGVWWTQAGSSGVQYDNTQFMISDMDGNGISDLYYATSTNWNNPGFSMALMHNNGNSLSWWGSQWAPKDLKLSQTRFIPGYWKGGNKEGFAYITKRSDGGFALAIFNSSSSGLQWQGVWWDNPTLSYDSISFVPADTDADGITDLYYATPRNGGFDLALQHNNSNNFSWVGQQWNPSGLNLTTTRFLPMM